MTASSSSDRPPAVTDGVITRGRVPPGLPFLSVDVPSDPTVGDRDRPRRGRRGRGEVDARQRAPRPGRRRLSLHDCADNAFPGFGPSDASPALVGLTPAAHGGNLTGRMFTGDPSDDALSAAPDDLWLASRPTARHRDDGLMLHGVRITVPVDCIPPNNRPTTTKRNTCRPWLARELELLPPTMRAIVVLGGFAWQALPVGNYHGPSPRGRCRPQPIDWYRMRGQGAPDDAPRPTPGSKPLSLQSYGAPPCPGKARLRRFRYDALVRVGSQMVHFLVGPYMSATKDEGMGAVLARLTGARWWDDKGKDCRRCGDCLTRAPAYGSAMTSS
ncbi:uracil-DNA glycosylase family protein [Streptomyces sp. NPDC004561]